MNMWTPPTPLPALMGGLRADKFDPNFLLIEPGFFAGMGGANVFTLASNLTIDATRWMPNGRDRANPGGLAGQFGWAEGQAFFTYFLTKDADGSIVGLLSPGYDYGDVIVPAGYTMQRKHPYMGNWRAAWGGICPFHFRGIQNPTIMFSLFDTSPMFYCGGGDATQPTLIDISHMMPVAGGARMAHLRYEVSQTPGMPASEGTGYAGVSDPTIELGAFNPNVGGPAWGDITIRVSSSGGFYYRTNNPAVSVLFYLRGYDITEVTT